MALIDDVLFSIHSLGTVVEALSVQHVYTTIAFQFAPR
jgi:hypothetical protein